MDKKYFISITGTSCVGKSTLLKAISVSDPNIFIIPQVTSRPIRSDDEERYIVHEQSLHPDQLFLYNKEVTYGIRKKDVENFIISDSLYAFCINGTDEIEMISQISQSYPKIEFKNILLSFKGKYAEEVQELPRQFKKYFDEENRKKRITFYTQHIKNKLLNPRFIREHIDLHLTREMPLNIWSEKISNTLGINSKNLYQELQNTILMNGQKKKYVNPIVKQSISEIIIALYNNKKQI